MKIEVNNNKVVFIKNDLEKTAIPIDDFINSDNDKSIKLIEDITNLIANNMGEKIDISNTEDLEEKVKIIYNFLSSIIIKLNARLNTNEK